MKHTMRSVSVKRLFASAHDAIMAGVALLVALIARYGIGELPSADILAGWTLGFMMIAIIVFRLFGLGRGMWRFASITDLRAIVLAASVTIVAFMIVLFLFNRLEGFPRTSPIIAWFVMIVLMGAPRLAYRALKDGGLTHIRPRDLAPDGVENVVIIGSASEADRVIRTYGLEAEHRYRVHGIIDYKSDKRGRLVRGIPIIGGVSELTDIVARLSRGGITINAGIVASPQTDRMALQDLATVAAQNGLPLRRVAPKPLTNDEPDLAALTLEDLLGRPPVKLNLDNIQNLITGRVVLVTGAGGSIGSELARQIAQNQPAKLVLIDNSEYALYRIDQALGNLLPSLPRRAVIADVRNRQAVARVFAQENPALVFHAAALKHVPLVEANPGEGVLTNVIGTRNVADAAVDADVEAVIVISTDKAIRPTSVMGATKRAAETYCQALDVSGVKTRFITVRFGNVLGSTGSVVPLFKKQIEGGGPVTVTSPEMRRYFMTVKEAVELVLQATAGGIDRPDQRGRISVLDMGEPVRIVDLARTMIALSGKRPDIDIPIVFTGLRPGEKLFEELFEDDEATLPSGADGVFVATARFLDRQTIIETLMLLDKAAMEGHESTIRHLLTRFAPSLPVALQQDSSGAEIVLLQHTRHRQHDGNR